MSPRTSIRVGWAPYGQHARLGRMLLVIHQWRPRLRAADSLWAVGQADNNARGAAKGGLERRNPRKLSPSKVAEASQPCLYGGGETAAVPRAPRPQMPARYIASETGRFRTPAVRVASIRWALRRPSLRMNRQDRYKMAFIRLSVVQKMAPPIIRRTPKLIMRSLFTTCKGKVLGVYLKI